MQISCAFATSWQTPDHVVEAERLGYRRAWLYDSPALYPDVWAVLALAAQRTSTIALGPGVLVPSLRHPMVTAAAIAGLEQQAPGRAVVAIGSGFTGRRALGRKAMRWTDVEGYVEVLRALLRGEDAQWEGATIRMLQTDAAYGADRPIDVPILIGAEGPKGLAVAKRLGDGVFAAQDPSGAVADGHDWVALLGWGTVLDPGEDPAGERVLEAAGHAAVVLLHIAYEFQGRAAVAALPGGEAWVERIEALPEHERHLAIHEGHLVRPNVHDRAAWQAGASAMVGQAGGLTGTAEELRPRIEALEQQGVTELVYQPAGGDIVRELHAFAELAEPLRRNAATA